MTSFGWTRLQRFMCNGIQNLHVLGHGWENTICSIMGDAILMYYTVSSVHSHLNHACFTLLLTVSNVNNACCGVSDDLRHWFPYSTRLYIDALYTTSCLHVRYLLYVNTV